MPIKLIKEDERLIFEFEGAELIYRRIPQNLQRQWVKECTNRKTGFVDWARIGQKAMQYAVLSWGGVEDDNGEVEFNKDLLDCLPGAMINEFTDVLLDGMDSRKSEESEKN